MASTMLLMIGGVVLQLALRFILLILPTVLLLWTVRVIYRRRSFKDMRVLVALNLLLPFSLCFMMASVNTERIYQIIWASYSLAFVVLIFSAVWGIYVWAMIQFVPGYAMEEMDTGLQMNSAEL